MARDISILGIERLVKGRALARPSERSERFEVVRSLAR